METYLPVVKPEISHSVARGIIDKYDEQYAQEELAKLDEDNPVIAEWIRRFSDRTDDKLGAMFCGLLVYKLLHSQAEANQMMEEIRLE